MKRKIIGLCSFVLGGAALWFGAPRAVDSFGDYWKNIYSEGEISARIYNEVGDLNSNSIRCAEERILELNSELRYDKVKALERFGNYSLLSCVGCVGMVLGGYGFGKEFFGRRIY